MDTRIHKNHVYTYLLVVSSRETLSSDDALNQLAFKARRRCVLDDKLLQYQVQVPKTASRERA